MYHGGILVGSLKCNFENLPFNFVIDTTTADWTVTNNGTLTVTSSALTLKKDGVNTSIATYYTTVPITEGCTLNLEGTVKYSTSSASEGSSYSAVGKVQVSKDGSTWETLVEKTATAAAGKASASATIASTIDMSAYAGYNCYFRVAANNTRAANGTYSTLTLTAFNLTY